MIRGGESRSPGSPFRAVAGGTNGYRAGAGRGPGGGPWVWGAGALGRQGGQGHQSGARAGGPGRWGWSTNRHKWTS